MDNNAKRKYVITGSQNFLLLEKISQSLAGRVAIFHLLEQSSGYFPGLRPFSCFVRWDTQKEKINLLCENF